MLNIHNKYYSRTCNSSPARGGRASAQKLHTDASVTAVAAADTETDA